MKSTRREILMFAGGSALGVAFTPIPWRAITDTALWSENWPGVPVPARGERRTRLTNCSLCNAGCAVRASCIGDQPIALFGANGPLCPFGLAGHHLPYLPMRVKQGPVKEAAAAIAGGIANCETNECVAVLDLRPARTASWTYRRAMAALPNGRYVTPSADTSVAVDLAKARTVLSFGVPVLDGWGTPGNVIAARAGFQLIQVEAVESHTASMADQWLRVRPGSEDALAQALAGQMTIAAAADATGLAEARIADVAAQLRSNGPALVLGSSRLPSTGRTLVARRETPIPETWRRSAPVTPLDALPDRSVRVLLIDEAAPAEYVCWNAIAKKLVDNAVVVAFAWSSTGYARHAQYVVPTAVYPEVLGDIPAAIDSVAATFRFSIPLVTAPTGVVNPAEFVARVAGLPAGDPLRERADAIHKTGRGAIRKTAIKDIGADDFWKALNAGESWADSPDANAPAAQWTAPAPHAVPMEQADLPLTVALNRELTPGSPILSKLYQESNLRLGPGRVALHPSCGLPQDAHAKFQTPLGASEVTVVLDAGIPPGVVAVTASPTMLDICGDGSPAKVVRI